MNSKKYFLAFLCFFLNKLSMAEDGGCKEYVFKELNHLPNIVESYPFRVWYATEGQNALKNSDVDSSISDRPIVINDLLLQLHSADKYFSEKLKLINPLKKQRYKQAEYIDVYLVAMKRGNGSAFDEVVAGKKSKNAEGFSCGIKIHINKNNQPSRSITPAHELFHLYQYSNSMFKSSWYLEGMTRWIERAFVGTKERDLNAVTPSGCSDVYQEKYTASRYWQDLAKRKGAKDIIINQEYLDIRYSNGQPVFKTNMFRHGSLVQSIFKVLEKESFRQSKENNLPRYIWPEKIQRSANFDKDICRAIEEIDFF